MAEDTRITEQELLDAASAYTRRREIVSGVLQERLGLTRWQEHWIAQEIVDKLDDG